MKIENHTAHQAAVKWFGMNN